MKNVGIFRMTFPEPSETFISQQAGAFTRYRPTYIAKRRVADTRWPLVALSDERAGWLRERAFLLGRWPALFPLEKLRQLHVIHAHFGVDGVFALPLARRLDIPLVVTFHGFDILTRREEQRRSREWPIYQYLAHLNELKREGARFLAVSKYVERALLQEGFARAQVIQHYIGVDTEKFSPGPGETAYGRYVLSVGRHVEFKGIDTLLRAFARLPKKFADVTLVQVGAGPLGPRLRALAEELGLGGRVIFLGAQPHERVLALMRAALLFALPSRTQKNGQGEALGIVFNEASACGVPVISTRCGGIPEVVVHGETGLLCDEDDVEFLAQNMGTLLDDPNLRERMGQCGREYVLKHFDLHSQARKLEDIYDQIS